MKAGALKEAQRLVAQRESVASIRDRLAAGEALHLVLGEGDKASEIVLAAGYLKTIRDDVLASLGQRIADVDASLAAIGVEP